MSVAEEPLVPSTGDAGRGVAPAGSAARSGIVVAAGMAAANLLGYAFNMVGARVLGPADYGALGALLGLVLIGSVAALALQAVVARQVAVTQAADGPSPGARLLVRQGVRAGLAVGGVALLASPLVTYGLRLDGPAPALWLAAGLVPLTMIGMLQGYLQGTERFGALAVVFLVAAAGKVGGGLIGLALVPSPTAAMAGMAVCSVLAVLVGWRVVAAAAGSAPDVAAGSVAELLAAGQSLLLLLALTNTDVLLARRFLDEHDAGLYAVGAVVAKGAYWLPQFVAVLAFPRLADPDRRRHAAGIAVALVFALGVLTTAVVAVAPRVVVLAVGGAEYAQLSGQVALFAAAGSSFALAQLLLYSRLATHDRQASVSLIVGLAVLVGVVVLWLHDSVTQIVAASMGVALFVCVVGLLAELREHR